MQCYPLRRVYLVAAMNNGNYAAFRGDVPLYLGEYFAPIARFYFSDYGTSLPAAGNKGRVFFKKA